MFCWTLDIPRMFQLRFLFLQPTTFDFCCVHVAHFIKWVRTLICRCCSSDKPTLTTGNRSGWKVNVWYMTFMDKFKNSFFLHCLILYACKEKLIPAHNKGMLPSDYSFCMFLITGSRSLGVLCAVPTELRTESLTQAQLKHSYHFMS